MEKKYNKELLYKIKADLDERLASFQETTSDSHEDNAPSNASTLLINNNNDHNKNDRNLHGGINNYDTYDDENLIFELDNISEPILNNNKNLRDNKKRKSRAKLSLPVILLIAFSILILAYIYKMNHDLKKEIAIENELKKQEIDYKSVKDNQYKDVTDDFFDDDLQEIDAKKREKTKKTP